jgi:phospholipid/cholesterol/gamma-HCH transport system substrate-binding protein
MKPVSKAQKVRLGIFLIIGGVLLGGTLVILIGMAALEEHDDYSLYFSGSISGLETGSVVRYNGLPVGRVESVKIDPKRITEVQVYISVDHGTLITEATVATLQMQGITGLKYIELKNRENESPLVQPGSTIPVEGSDFDDLANKATQIANKIDTAIGHLNNLLADDKIGALIDNIVKLTGDQNGAIVTQILAEVEGNLKATRALLENPDIQKILANTSKASDEIVFIAADVRATVSDVRATMADMRVTIASTSAAVNAIATSFSPQQIKRVVTRVEQVLDQLKARVGPEELGATLASANVMMTSLSSTAKNIDVTVLRTRDDLRRMLDSMITGAENFSDFAQILVDNPSALLSGRKESERALP